MRQPREITLDGKAWCSHHAKYEQVEDFNWHSHQTADGSVGRIPKANCRLAEQTIRDHGKEADPARHAIESRAKEYARDLSKALGRTISYTFVLVELNRRALIPIMRALLSPDGLCLNCGRHRHGARELHIEHRVPPLTLVDWPAQHARNLWIACAGCNVEKGRNEANREWLEQEHRKWITDRGWAVHAGEKGWPVYESSFGEAPLWHAPPSLQLMIEGL
jgi:5-methylcytosine-specific restriction endonuclease McrA